MQIKNSLLCLFLAIIWWGGLEQQGGWYWGLVGRGVVLVCLWLLGECVPGPDDSWIEWICVCIDACMGLYVLVLIAVLYTRARYWYDYSWWYEPLRYTSDLTGIYLWIWIYKTTSIYRYIRISTYIPAPINSVLLLRSLIEI